MSSKEPAGWDKLLQGYPWFSGKGQYPIPAYSEFMPPPRFGRSPYGEIDTSHFIPDDPFGWYGKPAYNIAGQKGRNLTNNPYWPPELEARAGKLPHEQYVVFLPIALSKTQDDKGRVRWTFFGGSEQGPERAFWKSFYAAPQQEVQPQEALSFLCRLLSSVYHENCPDVSSLKRIGFRFLPTELNASFPYWG